MCKNKTVPIELSSFSTTGSATQTLRLSSNCLYASEAKQGYNECIIVAHISALSGSSPTIQFDAYETFDGADIHVGTTGTITTADDRVIDSAGGATSAGATFTATSMIRLLGKGTDLVIKGTTTGTVGTIAGTLSIAFY